MKWYHGTSSKNNILKEGFKTNYGRFGEGVYFSNNRDEALTFGNELIEIDSLDHTRITSVYYPDLIRLYPDLSVDEEEGLPELKDRIVNRFKKDGVILTYASGEKELCIYNTNIIKL